MSTSAPIGPGNFPWWHDGNAVQSITEGGITRYPVEFPVNIGVPDDPVWVRPSAVQAVLADAEFVPPDDECGELLPGTAVMLTGAVRVWVPRTVAEVVALLWPVLAVLS